MFGYGNKEIDALRGDLGQDEDIYLSDYSDRLRGDVVKKKQVVIGRLKRSRINLFIPYRKCQELNQDFKLILSTFVVPK